MEAELPPGPSIVESFKMAFDDSQTSDVKFIVEGRTINAHRALLKIRCQHFRSMFQDGWEENDRYYIIWQKIDFLNKKNINKLIKK